MTRPAEDPDRGKALFAYGGRPEGGYPEGVLDVQRPGRTRYEDAYLLQRHALENRIAGRWGDVLILTEHEPVVTVGRGAESHGSFGDLPVVEVERGGEATYHGPGQLIAYPIFELPEGRRDLHRYLRDLEEVVIRVLFDVDLQAERRPGLTGVWVGDKKICSVGVAVKQWVTWHGLALNVRTDLQGFRGFEPCGLSPEVMTRAVDHVELPPTSALFEVLLVKHFVEVFEMELPPLVWPTSEELGGEGDGQGGFPTLPVLPS